MKKTIALIVIAFMYYSFGTGLAYGVSFLKFEREFSGKGSTNGAFSKNVHVAFDAEGNIFVSDADNRLLQKLSSSGEFLMQIPTDPKSPQNFLKKPGDIAVDGKGNIYVADNTAHHIKETENPKIYMFAPCVYKLNPNGELMHTYFVDPVDVRPKQVLPAHLMIDEDGKSAFGIQPKLHDRKLLVDVNRQNQLFVLDQKKATVHTFGADGEKITEFGRYGAGNGEFDSDASDIEIDSAGNVLIADTGNHRVVKFNPDGQFVLSFGVKGRGSGEFTKPLAIAALSTGEILVKDASQFKRHLGGLPAGGLMTLISPSGVGIADTVAANARNRNTILGQNVPGQTDLDVLQRRIRLLEEAEYRRYFSEYFDEEDDKDKNKKEEDEDLKAAAVRATIYHNVIARVQKFDSSGRYKDRVIYEVDKQSDTDRDIAFLALDSLGRIYLRDASDLTIHQFSIAGFTIKPSHMNALYNSRASNIDTEFLEDYEDIDEHADVVDQFNQLRMDNTFFWTYALSERWNLMLVDTLSYGEIDERYTTPPKREDSYDLDTNALTNTFAANLKFITNPNPYQYQELNLYAERVDGRTELGRNAIYQDLNRQRQEDEGDAASLAVGLNWDILSKMNLWLEYSDLNPADTSRNYTRRYFDVSGDLYEVFATRNQRKQFLGELSIKF